MDLQLLDDSNNGIENVAIKLEDKNGTEVFSLNTDIDGKITQQVVTSHQYSWASGSDPGATTDTGFNDFTLTLTATGYQAYVKQFSLDEPIDWRLFPQPIIANALTSRVSKDISFDSPTRNLTFAASGREF